MGLAAFICIFLGVYPQPLYHLLPYAVTYAPYTPFHVLAMLQLLMFGALAFTVLVLSGHYPPEMRAVNLDTDWFVRLPARGFLWLCDKPLKGVWELCSRVLGMGVAEAKALPALSAAVEKGTDALVHGGLTALPRRLFSWGRHLGTERRTLSWNLAYILLPFCGLLLLILLLR
jgi:hypothetical protein